MSSSERRRRPIQELFAPSAYSFVVVELQYKNESDITGLVRNELDTLLPHGIDGTAFFFQRIGRSRRFVVTLLKLPLPAGFRSDRASLPFALTVAERGTCVKHYESGTRSFTIEYEGGSLKSIAQDDSEESEVSGRIEEARLTEADGPPIQFKIGGETLRWRIVAFTLAVALAAQIALIAANAIYIRSSRLAALEGYLSRLDASPLHARSSKAGKKEEAEYQDRAAELATLVSSSWKDGFFLTSWTLKAGKLRLEGWGQGALGLLSSLKSVPDLRGLSLSSMKNQQGIDFFIFEGTITND